MSALEQLIDRIGGATTGAARADVLMSLDLSAVEGLLHGSFDDPVGTRVLATGLAASPGAASGRIVLSAHEALEVTATGAPVILVRPETTPEDVAGMQVSAGILTARGGLASHAAVVARGWGIPAVVGATNIGIDGRTVRIGDTTLHAGDYISIDGRTGHIYEGAMAVSAGSLPPEVAQLWGWAAAVTDGHVAVKGNADNARDAAQALSLGASGIGLCRTEHMFLSPDRLPLIRTFILGDNNSDESAHALARLEEAQSHDFEAMLRVLRGKPVTVRLLDPPLHEFLPEMEPLVVAEARGELSPESEKVLSALRRLHEVNPMIGTRGVRLGVIRNGLYQMQIRALSRAVKNLESEQIECHVEILIPLVIDAHEFAMARGWVDDTVRDVGVATASAISVGAMIETPRAALMAGEIARHADFLSFGTNDLTQLTLAFSRDDVEHRLLGAYIEAGILAHNPFAVLDQPGVGQLVSQACASARATAPAISLSVCGEHAGDGSSVSFLLEQGVTALSCSPFRVPVARLAAARSLLQRGVVDASRLDDPTAPEAGTARGDRATGGSSAVDADDVLHVLRVRGLVTIDGLCESLDAPTEAVGPVLRQMVDAGLVRVFEARGLYQLTPDGTAHHESRMAATVSGTQRDALRAHYGPFLALNTRLKELCTAWQTRDGNPNDHSDPCYDDDRIAELGALLRDTHPVIDGFASGIGRFASYGIRLSGSYTRLREGQTNMFTGVMCGSFHDVWMELHEDLIRILGIDRSEEGSA